MQKRDKHAPHLAQYSPPSSSDQSPDCSFSSASVYLVDCPTQYSTRCSTDSQVPCQLPKKQGAGKSAPIYLALETRSPRWARSCRGSNPLLPRTPPLRSGWCAPPRRQAPQSCGQPGQVESLEQASSSDLFKIFIFSSIFPKCHLAQFE